MKPRIYDIIFFMFFALLFFTNSRSERIMLQLHPASSNINTPPQHIVDHAKGLSKEQRAEIKNKMRTKALDGNHALKVLGIGLPAFLIFNAKQINLYSYEAYIYARYFYDKHLRSLPYYSRLS